MHNEPSLFDPPAAPKRPPRKRRKMADTSTDGLLDVQPRKHTQCALILETLRAWGSMTRHEIAISTGLPLSSICGRVAECIAAGSVREQVVAGRRVRRDGRHVVEAVITQTMRRAG